MTMSAFSPSPFVPLVALGTVLLAMRWLFRTGKENGQSPWATLRIELAAVKRVWSAQTVANTEAEFIRDRLPTRRPSRLIWLACVLLAATAWLLAQ